MVHLRHPSCAGSYGAHRQLWCTQAVMVHAGSYGAPEASIMRNAPRAGGEVILVIDVALPTDEGKAP